MATKATVLFQNIRRLPAEGETFVPWFAIAQKAHRPVPQPHPQLSRALAGGLCWLCGRQRGAKATFILPVRGALERDAFDPPSHWGCAIFAARFWIPGGRLGWFESSDMPDPRLTWLKDPDDERVGASAVFATVLWQTDDWQKKARHFDLGEPSRVDWWRNGEPLQGVPFDPESYLGALAERRRLLPLIERLRPWLP